MTVASIIDMLEEAYKDLVAQDATWRSDLIDRCYHATHELWLEQSSTVEGLLRRLRPDLAGNSADPDNVRGQTLANLAAALNWLRTSNIDRNARLTGLKTLIDCFTRLK